MKKQHSTLLSIFFLIISPLAFTQTVYVTDQQTINMRTGIGSGFKIIKILKTGDELEVLEIKKGYYQVKTMSGKVGWVLKRFLTEEKLAGVRIAEVEKKQQICQTQNDQLTSFIQQLVVDVKQSTNMTMEQKLQNIRLNCGKSLALAAENEQLRKDLIIKTNAFNLLQQKYQSSHDKANQRWFMIGAGVLFFGVFLGVLIPKLQQKHDLSSSW